MHVFLYVTSFGTLALILSILQVMKPRKLKITVKLLPFPTFSIEAESGDAPRALTPNSDSGQDLGRSQRIGIATRLRIWPHSGRTSAKH